MPSRDPCCVEIVGGLKRRRGGGDHLLAYRERRAWHQVHAPLINAHLKGLIGDSYSAKNFRTWNGTLLAAVALARCEDDCASERGRRSAIRRATTEVSEVLGNTPAVARGSYIDPRVFDRFLSGWTIAGSCDASRNGVSSRRSVEPLSSLPSSTCSRGSQRGHDPTPDRSRNLASPLEGDRWRADELRPDGPRR